MLILISKPHKGQNFQTEAHSLPAYKLFMHTQTKTIWNTMCLRRELRNFCILSGPTIHTQKTLLSTSLKYGNI